MTVQELYEQIGGSYESAKRVMQMDKLIAKFIVRYLDDASCAKLCEGWAARDGALVFEGAHAMKGVCANLGLDTLSAGASELAEEFRPGNSRTLGDDEVTERVEALRTLNERTLGGIRAFADKQ